MATPILSPDAIIWRLDPSTGQVDIVADGTILETVNWSDAPSRLNYHRNQAAQTRSSDRIRSVDWLADGTPVRKRRVRR